MSATAPTDAPTAPPIPTLDQPMSIMEHLKELRYRLGVVFAALFIGFIVATFIPIPVGQEAARDAIVSPLAGTTTITSEVIRILLLPVHQHIQAIRPGEVLFTYFKVAMYTAGALALPVVLYQLIAFVKPALLDHEKKYLYMALPGVFISFLVGVAFGYLVLIPFAITFLLSFGASIVEQKWAFSEYLETISTLLFWMGVVFEMPLVIYFMTKLGIVSAKRLSGFRRYMLVLAFVLGAFITPTPDPFNQALVSIPIYLLYELGILLARFA